MRTIKATKNVRYRRVFEYTVFCAPGPLIPVFMNASYKLVFWLK